MRSAVEQFGDGPYVQTGFSLRSDFNKSPGLSNGNIDISGTTGDTKIISSFNISKFVRGLSGESDYPEFLVP